MTIDDPWAGLSPGSIDARRVDPTGHHDFFWVVSADGEPGLALVLAPETEEKKPLPKMRSLDIAYRDVPGGRALVVLLRDGEQRELFANLGGDIVAAAAPATDCQGALARAVQRTLRWHHLLRGGRSGVLSLEEQRGLVGELGFLDRLCELLSPRAAIEAWRGPTGAAKDFELSACLVEVKARRGASKPFVQISSADQLSDVADCRLFLVVASVDAAVKPDGLALTDHVRIMDEKFAGADLEAYQLWEEAIAATGFRFEDDYSDRRWSTGQIAHFEVGPSFPRIVTPLATGVSEVRYRIALDACQDHAIEAEVIEHCIKGAFSQ